MEATRGWTMKNVLAWCATITAFFLIFRSGTSLKIADVLLVLLGILVAAGAETRSFFKNVWPKIWSYLKYFALLIGFIALAQLISYAAFGANPFQSFTLGLYARVIFQTYAFFLAAFLIAFDRRLLAWMSAAIFVSPVVMVPIYWQQDANWYLSGSRLAGFLQSPIVLGVWMMIAFFIGLGFFLDAKAFWKKTLIAIWLVIVANFILWSGTRAVWIALPLGLILWTGFSCFKEKNFKKAGYLILVPLAAFFFGYAMLAFSRPTYKTQSFLAERAVILFTRPLVQQTNAHDWSKGVQLAANNPLGIGFPTPSETERRPDTDTLLEVFSYGGIGAFAMYLIVLGKLGMDVKNAIASLKISDVNHLAIAWYIVAPATILTTFLTTSFYFRLVWIALGIAAGTAWTYGASYLYNNTHKT